MADLDALLGDVLDDFDEQDAAASSQVPHGPEAASPAASAEDDVDILADQLADEFLAGLQLASDSTEVNGLVENLMSQLQSQTTTGTAATSAAASTTASASARPKPATTADQTPDDSDMEHAFEELLKNLGEVTRLVPCLLDYLQPDMRCYAANRRARSSATIGGSARGCR
jgi:hypothetical protein